MMWLPAFLLLVLVSESLASCNAPRSQSAPAPTIQAEEQKSKDQVKIKPAEEDKRGNVADKLDRVQNEFNKALHKDQK